jgi:hypothetical protein
MRSPSPVGTKISASALAVKRFLAIRTRFHALRFWLWKYRYGVRPVHNFRKRLARQPNVEIITGDATELLPDDGTLFFLFNPFGPHVVRRFVGRLKPHLDMRIIYFYCLHVDIFENDARWRIEELRTGDHKRAVLIRPHADVRSARGGAVAGAGSYDQNHQLVAERSRAGR